MTTTNLKKYDQYYTKVSVASDCMNTFLSLYQEDYFFCEPSVGAGAFYNILPNDKRIGFDIDPPSGVDCIKTDFLTADISEYINREKTNNIVTIGNPPFGKNASTAIKFMNKCSEFSKIIAFILPKTFKKDSIKKSLNKTIHLVYENDIPANSFIADQNEYDVPCVFQIWEVRPDDHREDINYPLTHPDFQFVSKTEATIAFRRVGVKAGAIYEEFEKYAPASHYFIKCSSDVQQRLQSIASWDDIKFNTAGNPSISKRELIKKYKELFPSIEEYHL